MGEQAELFAGEPMQGAHTPGSPCTPPTDEAGAEKDGAASGPPEFAPESGAAPSSATARERVAGAVLTPHEAAVWGVVSALHAEDSARRWVSDAERFPRHGAPWTAVRVTHESHAMWAEAVCDWLRSLTERPAAVEAGHG